MTTYGRLKICTFMKICFCLFVLFCTGRVIAQVPLDLSAYNKKNGVLVTKAGKNLDVRWPVGKKESGRLVLNLEAGKPLFEAIEMSRGGKYQQIGRALDPVFVVTIGKRDLVSQNGWNIFFDRVPLKPFRAFTAEFTKRNASVTSDGSRTVISVSEIKADRFSGDIQITLYNGSPLFNVAAVMSTSVDSTAVIYDAGLASDSFDWEKITWSDPYTKMQETAINRNDTSVHLAVKYRSIIGVGKQGSLAVFPAPHQYFYPLDEAFNLKFTWYGSNFRKMVPAYGIGIRQDLYGDRRYVPWFNAPPGTWQRMNFFCLLSTEKQGLLLNDVKQFTNNDTYRALPGYKTMSSHFHVEHTRDVLSGKQKADTPNFVEVLRNTGVNIIHLAEFHGPGHPKGPADTRFLELHTLFNECRRLSTKDFLLLPGEEPNNFFGGHWLEFFPKPVYWVMSRKPEEPFVSQDPMYGKVYRIGDKDDMLKLLELENGLAWTAHARTKGSTGFPDRYKTEKFFTSNHFFGAAWKPMPADLSQPMLGKRVLDLMDDMANWGERKHVIAESDIFQIEPDFEVYAHLNVNYLQLDKLPAFDAGWQPVLDAMRKGKFFVSTGEVLLPFFTVDGKQAGDSLNPGNKPATIKLKAEWTFPLNYIEIISGDGVNVHRQRIDLHDTESYGKKEFSFKVDLKGRKWVRVECWDVAANGAFTQQVWLD
jgi:hypothetical protein